MRGFGVITTGKAGWMEKERPVAGPLDAIVKPIVLAPCTSDVHNYHGGAGPKENLILGHEVVGEVVEVGDMVTRFKPGDKVVVATTTPDWLALGVQEKYNAHDSGPLKSFKFTSSRDGVFSEYFLVNQADANMTFLPENVKPEAALMVVDMMSTGFHGVELAEINFGENVVVIGIGPVGLMAVAGSALRGAGKIMAVGTRPDCVKIAREYGATDIINYKEGDILDQVMELTNGEGADKVIIAGGKPESFTKAVQMTRAGGIVSNLVFWDAIDVLSIPAPAWGLGMKNVDIRGGFCPGGALRMERLLNVLENGRLDTTKLISHRYEGFDKIEDAFYLMDEKPRDLIKPVVFI
ncbi:Threonine dehydrogenase [Anaerosphaera aminiphila DSM 21120]|uniref:Threonine dehydrogenase n=1 Tax=Anaerosphaera aminiphila DSM 21120 TaxID=1120995 RepID=A0A1M5PUU6_9FIRM|nr:zinc-binding dehydrogenase [Anaerosphaera aminiphila]SHH05376.1 Threonine dehydrogenase [Anaerosphaera aminiphila DSM 21120]